MTNSLREADQSKPGWQSRTWPILWAILGAYLIVRTGIRDRGVITDHLEFGRRVLNGLDLYAPFAGSDYLHPPYPPSFGLLTAPFSLLPERLARFAWGALQVGCIWILALRTRDLVRDYAPAILPKLNWLFLFVAILTSRYLLRDTHGGGGNLINLALILSSLEFARQKREMSAGVLLGFSLATKPVAVLMLPLLWLFGQRRAAGVALVTAAACMALALSLLGQGMGPFLQWFDGSTAYASMPDVFATPSHGFPPFSWMNQCLRCGVARFLCEVPATLAAEVPNFSQGMGLAPAAATWVTRALSLALTGLTFFLVWRRADVPAARPCWVAAVLALSLLLSPISWKAHHVALIPAFALLGCLALAGRRWPWFWALAYFGFCVIGEQFVGKEFKNLQQSCYFTTFGTLAALALCLFLGSKAARDATALQSEPTGR
ncbi:MAG: glycosyltransferase family 87 protein [Planctomycetota bacterium]|nr:glycosyltransferase family 87 protein [Planctomycetota bacterium]